MSELDVLYEAMERAFVAVSKAKVEGKDLAPYIAAHEAARQKVNDYFDKKGTGND